MAINKLNDSGSGRTLAGASEVGSSIRPGAGSTTIVSGGGTTIEGATASGGASTKALGNASTSGEQGATMGGDTKAGGIDGAGAGKQSIIGATGDGAAGGATTMGGTQGAAASTTLGAGANGAATTTLGGAGGAGGNGSVIVTVNSGTQGAQLSGGMQTIVANLDLMDGAQANSSLRSNGSSLLPSEVTTTTTQTYANSLQDLIDAVTRNESPQNLQQLMRDTTESIQNQSANNANTQSAAQQNDPAASQQASAEAQLQQQAHAQKLAQQAARAAGTNDAITYALVSELLALSPAATALKPEESLATNGDEAGLLATEHGAEAMRPESKVVQASVAQDADVHASASVVREGESKSLDNSQSFSLASLPQDSDAQRMAQDPDSHISPADPRSFFRDADTGKLLMRAGEGPWVVFDSQGRMLGQWRGNKTRRDEMKIGARGRVARNDQDKPCKLFNECDREGLPSCCQNQGTF